MPNKLLIVVRPLKVSLLGSALFAYGINSPSASAQDLTNLGMEELLQVEVTSVSKRPQSLSSAAAAIHVITQEDIRRSGATSLPEALRMAPGVHVGHIDGNKWSVGVRGLGGRWSNQLLVLMDGRTLYSPLFSGVYWEAQDTLLEDIDRIEVIRGPGGTLWGSNAVNGVINIITKSAKDTQGGLAYGRYGSLEDGGGLRYGSKLGESTYGRAYIKYNNQNDFVTASRLPADDRFQNERAGFRVDSDPSADDKVTLQGEIYHGLARQTAVSTPPGVFGNALVLDTAQLNGANLLGRWRHQLANGDLQLQTYFDRAERRDASMDQGIDTWDIELQHHLRLYDIHNVVWGGGYRLVSDELTSTPTVAFTPGHRKTPLYNVFAQDEIELDPTVHLTLGSKFEHNAVTGLEVQPSARLIWQPDDSRSLWGAVSRVVRTPSRADRDMALAITNIPIRFSPYGPPVAVPLTFQGNNGGIDTTKMLAFEIGYRQQINSHLSVDGAGFYYDYDQLVTLEPAGPGRYRFSNNGEGTIYGFEVSANWQIKPDWQLRSSYSRAEFNAMISKGNKDNLPAGTFETSGPKNMFQLQSHYQLTSALDFDAMLYWVDKVNTIGNYQRVDAKMTWRPWSKLELSLVGQNLLDGSHPEALNSDTVASEVPRAVYGQARITF